MYRVAAFFSVLRVQSKDRKEAKTQLIGSSKEVSTWKFKVKTFCDVIFGLYWDRQVIREADTTLLVRQVNRE